jgi:hypothetical protein
MEWTGQVYADSPVVATQILIDAPPERVWDLVSEIALMAELSSELQEVTWLDGGPEMTGPAVGHRFTGRNAHPAMGEWETVSTVTECDPPHRFAWAVGDPAVHPEARWGGHTARAVVPDGPGPFRPEYRHRRDAGQGGQDRFRPDARARDRHEAQPGRD